MRRSQDAPPLALYLTEFGRAAGEYGLLLAAKPALQLLPFGDGHPVLVLPGLLADDLSTRPLRRTLRRLGYRVHGWGLGRNLGPTDACVSGLTARLDELHARYARPVSVIGWSLGGIFARQLARDNPQAIRQVITLGSPFRLARHSQSRATRAYERFTHLHAVREELPLERDATPLAMPTTSIYSAFDGIVHWTACLNLPGERSENIAVIASHLGLGHHPAALWAIADRLAQPEGTWRPFVAPTALRFAFPRPHRASDGAVA